MSMRQMVKTILGPSKSTVEREVADRLFNLNVERDRKERDVVRARLRAVEISLPIAMRRELRG